jgi:hypothetical protein
MKSRDTRKIATYFSGRKGNLEKDSPHSGSSNDIPHGVVLKFFEVLNASSLPNGQLKGCIVSLLLIKAHLMFVLQLNELAL